ncbi:hypothetical protein L7F22_063100 [Adiantum nelumboides]|nr:hypothetical protein [Adiantum nelumboides]
MAAQSQGLPYVACRPCTEHCQRIHSQGFSPCSRTPSFFSLLPPFPSCAPCSLPIPAGFLGGKNIRVDQTSIPGEHLYSETQLEGPSGATWIVAMQGMALDNLAFTTGWDKFVKDHSLVAGDLLFFKLLSRSSFSVSVYGSDGCEKAVALTAQNSGVRFSANAQLLKKRAAADNPFQDVGEDADAKKRKVDNHNQITPLIIAIDDDDDTDECRECAPKPQSSNACQVAGYSDAAAVVQVDIVESRDTYLLEAEESLHCVGTVKEVVCLQPVPVDVPLTPNNADKGILANKVQTPMKLMNKEDVLSDGRHLVQNSAANDEQEAASPEEEDVQQPDHQQKCIESEGLPSESDSEKDGFKDSLYCTDEATQQERMNDVKDYLTEAFISKRRPVTGEERQKALQAAKRFRSSLPHLRKLMKESHVYRGFWLSLASDFAIKYLPQEIQQATLLDSSGMAWSARWLGSRNGLSGGWRKFSLDHGLEEGDVCVFEVIDRKKLVFKVHIFRVIELKNGLPGRDHYLHKPPSKSLLEYECRRPSTSAKKMRGAIGSLQSSTLSSRLKEWNQRQAENKTSKGKDGTQLCKKNLRINSTGEGGRSHAEKCLQKNVEIGLREEAKGLSGCSTAEASLSLQTPPKNREPVPENLRTRLSGLTPARQPEPLLNGTQSGLLKATKEHPNGSKPSSCKKYYIVERLYNRRKGPVEEEFLVDLDIDGPLSGLSSKAKKDGNAWWVPLSHFTKDKTTCHL